MDYTKSGIYPYANGNAAFPGTSWTGPLIAGNVLATSGTTLAAAGTVAQSSGYVANAGVAVLSQSQAGITQAGTPVTTNIVIPAQSQILRITAMVTTATTSTTTFGIGDTTSATQYTGSTAMQGNAVGIVSGSPGTDATMAGHWDNVGATDSRIVVTFGSTGSGVITLTVEYVPMINLAS